MLEKAGHILSFWEKECIPTQEELIEICQQQDALVVADANMINATFLQACTHLKVIALHSVGYNHVDIEEANRLKIPIGNTPNAGSKEVADTAFFLMLAVSKKAFFMHQQIREQRWKHFEPTSNLGINLRGKTLGIFGLGDIGIEMARLSQAAFHMKILYHNRNRNIRAEESLQARYVSFNELLSESDILSIHVPLTAETLNKFNAEVFAKMKPTAILINTARGGIIEEPALTEALKNGEIWGAGLDVCRPEPMHSDNPLLSMPNVAVTPHIGAGVDTARSLMSKMIAENIIAAGVGKKIPYEVRILSPSCETK